MIVDEGGGGSNAREGLGHRGGGGGGGSRGRGKREDFHLTPECQTESPVTRQQEDKGCEV